MPSFYFICRGMGMAKMIVQPAAEKICVAAGICFALGASAVDPIRDSVSLEFGFR